MSTVLTVRWFAFFPFADTARGPHIGLRFEHNPDFVRVLRRLSKGYLWRVPAGQPALQWLDEDELWCLAPEIGNWVIGDLRARGYTLRKVSKPKRVQDRRPPPPAALDEALTQLRQSGGQLVVRDGKLLVQAGRTPLPAAVQAALMAHKPLLTWLLGSAAPAREAPAAERPSDPYALLGVQRGDPLPVIEKAYRAAIRAVHPDRIPSDMDPAIVALATQRATAVNVAWQRIKERKA